MRPSNELKKRRMISILSIVLLCFILTASFAWFITDETASIQSGGEMKITAGDRLEISLDGENWGHTMEPLFTQAPMLPDITGNGLQFYYPTVLDANDNVITENPETFHTVDMTKTEECNKYFVTVQVHFRSASNISVYLANTSAITPANTEVVGDNKSMFGEFSSDYIAGAARVAFLENTESGEVLKNVWIPNENIALSASTNPATLNPNSTTLERFENTVYPYGYMYVEENHVLLNPYTWEDYTNGVASVGSKSLAIPATETTESRINHATPLLTFENTDGKMQTKTLTVRIWVEGTDREADKALVGGKMNYLLNFIGIRKQTNEASLDQFTTDGDGVLKIGGADVAQDLVEYSHDGISWNPYYGVSLKKQGYTEVYVRYVETTFVAPSAPKKIVLPS